MAKILHVYKKAEIDFSAQKVIPACNLVDPTTASPKDAGVQKLKAVSSRVDNTTPVAENFFQHAGVDLLLCIWEFVHGGRLTDLLPLMLTSKSVYTRLENETVLVMQIAKSCLSFSYFATLPPAALKTFQSLLRYAEPVSGAELSHNSFLKQQYLRNSRLSRRPVFEVRMKVWPTRVFEGLKINVVRCHCARKDFFRLYMLLKEFEEAHNAIAMKIFWPNRDHFPLTSHNQSVYILTNAKEDFFANGKAFHARFRVRFRVSCMRYRFSFVAKRFDVAV